MNRKNIMRFIVVLCLLFVIAAFWKLKLTEYLSLESIRVQQTAIKGYYIQYPFLTVGIFFLAYILITALSFPGAAVMTILGGALFGFWQGVIIASFASSIGATLAFVLARFLMRDWIQGRYHNQLKILNDGFKKEGAFYLFTLRVVPAFPFFLVNILASIMPVKIVHFYGISQLGMLPGTIVYVFAGTELAKISSISGILSPTLFIAFILLGLFPIMAKKIIHQLRNKKKI